jgi:hypothetical protein
MEFGLQNQYGRVIHRLRKYIFGSQKGENRPSEPKNGFYAPKSVHIKFPIDDEYITRLY